MDNNLIKCDKCQNEFERDSLNVVYIDNDGNYELICVDCLAEKLNNCDIVKCYDCGDYYNASLTTITHDCNAVCEDCLSNDYFYCDDCHEYYDIDTDSYSINNGSYVVCEDCFNNGDYIICDDCGDAFESDYTYYDEDNYNHYCEDCYYNRQSQKDFENPNYDNNVIYGYHYHKNFKPKFKQLEEEKDVKFYEAFELETEYTNGTIPKEDLNFLSDRTPVYYEHDGSLHNGVEIISQPMSWKYIQHNKKKFKECLDYLASNNYKSHDTSTCGLHIHVSRPKEEVIDRIILIMETYKDVMQKVARRGSNSYTRFYSEKYECDKMSLLKLKSIKYIKDLKTTSERYMALNLTNEKTIEFRLFKGTLNYESFMSCLELVNNLVNLCSDLNKSLSSITWEALTNSPYLKKYCENNNIKTNIIPSDNYMEYDYFLKKLEIQEKNLRTINKKILYVVNAEKIKEIQKLTLKKSSDFEKVSSAFCDIKYKISQLNDTNNINLLAKFIIEYNEYYNVNISLIDIFKKYKNCEELRTLIFKFEKIAKKYAKLKSDYHYKTIEEKIKEGSLCV